MVKYHGLEFLECYLVFMINIMLVHDLLNLCRCQLVAKFGKGITQRRSADLIIACRVEPTEERVQSLLCRVLVHWESGSDKFMVVDHTRTVDIYLRDDALKLIIT